MESLGVISTSDKHKCANVRKAAFYCAKTQKQTSAQQVELDFDPVWILSRTAGFSVIDLDAPRSRKIRTDGALF